MTSLLGPLPNLLQLLAAPVPAWPWCLELTFWDLEEQLCQQGVQGPPDAKSRLIGKDPDAGKD